MKKIFIIFLLFFSDTIIADTLYYKDCLEPSECTKFIKTEDQYFDNFCSFDLTVIPTDKRYLLDDNVWITFQLCNRENLYSPENIIYLYAGSDYDLVDTSGSINYVDVGDNSDRSKLVILHAAPKDIYQLQIKLSYEGKPIEWYLKEVTLIYFP